MKIIAVYNLKGGVGKTATAVNLGWLASREGARTMVWDMDPQGAASFYFRIRPKVKGGSKALIRGQRELYDLVKGTDYPNLDLLPADFSYRRMDRYLDDGNKKPEMRLLKLLRPLDIEYDYVLLDCAPSISAASENVFRAADALLIPLIPTTLSTRTFWQIVDFIERKRLRHVRLLPFFSMVDRRRNMHREIMQSLPEQWPGILEASIPYASEVERMGLTRAAVGEYARHSAAAQAYEELWREIKERLHQRSPIAGTG